MKNINVSKAAEICGGRICGDFSLDVGLGRIVIDSRAVEPGDVFTALKGEKVDGHNYINVAFSKGASCCIAERLPEKADGPVILVDDAVKALEKLSEAYRKTLDIPVVGITGSVGKTSAKEMIWSVLSQRMNVHKTEGNLNNHLGVPMTLSQITDKHQAAVVEMGISGFGEMTSLAAMVRPDIAVFTIIGHAHLEFLHDLDGVFRAKTEMLPFVSDNGTVIVNGDDERLRALQCPQRKLCFGLSDGCDVKAGDVRCYEDGTVGCCISYGETGFDVHIPAYGQHMVYAALEGAAVGFVMGLSSEEIKAGIESYRTVGRRGAVTVTDSLTVVDDCYNANPDSVKCAIDSLMKLNGRHICILADMLEQGEQGKEMHFDVGHYARESGVDLVLTCGELGKYIAEGAGEAGVFFENTEELIRRMASYIRKGDCVLVKASQGMKLGAVSDALKGLEAV